MSPRAQSWAAGIMGVIILIGFVYIFLCVMRLSELAEIQKVPHWDINGEMQGEK